MSVAPVSRHRAGIRVVTRTAAVTTALLTALSLTACGSDSNDDRQTESAPSSTPTLADLVGQTWEKETPVIDLGPVTPRASAAGHAPSPTVATSAAAEPEIAEGAADNAVVPDATPDAVEPATPSTYTPEIGPNGYPLDPDIPGANQPLPGEAGYEEWQEYLDGLSNAERSNYGISAATPNDCDDFLGAHEDSDRSNCPA